MHGETSEWIRDTHQMTLHTTRRVGLTLVCTCSTIRTQSNDAKHSVAIAHPRHDAHFT